MDLITKAAFGTFKKKPLRHKKIFPFWNDTLGVKRNGVTALYRKYNSLKKNDAPGDSVLAAGIIYRKERSELKKLINTTKRKAWEIFCLNYNSKFGHTFKVALSKLKRNYNLDIKIPNNIFQAELEAINFAVGWALEGGFKVNIYTDSYSSIQVLKKSDVKSGFINDIKSNVFRALGSVGLSWVKAHAGIPGNELADQFAKSAITEGNFLDIPAPYSFLKKYIKNIILSDWQQHWGESDTSVRVREYVPFVDFNLLTHNRYLVFFISGHGPFPAYLFRFKILNSPNCICGGLGDPDHFVFDCPHTKDFHLACPSGIFKPDWFSSVLKNVGSLRSLQEICVISNRICNELKSLN
ncbi:hypothetical protein AVEN_230493-1 [Araneus ventricosus]|uniref:RNase H type-1 domain-containing protein n=1 Tax=Araneus ventricosus TaxID=182803 RepID=A0A4Y2IE08_ARAVE|nr:hypothetical protein AVEN_230493-1 [Araneus ventricosus]